jgi:hypothetical protein
LKCLRWWCLTFLPHAPACLACCAVCSAVFWLTAFSGASAIALLPDITHMLFSRYFRPTLATVLQVSASICCSLLWLHSTEYTCFLGWRMSGRMQASPGVSVLQFLLAYSKRLPTSAP